MLQAIAPLLSPFFGCAYRKSLLAAKKTVVVRQFVVLDMKGISFCLAQALRFGIAG